MTPERELREPVATLQKLLLWSGKFPGKTGAEMRCWIRDELAECAIAAPAPTPAPPTAESETDRDLLDLRDMVNLAVNGKCIACGWPLAESQDKGCVQGNCSYRPHESAPDYAGWHRRQHLAFDLRKQPTSPTRVPAEPVVPDMKPLDKARKAAEPVVPEREPPYKDSDDAELPQQYRPKSLIKRAQGWKEADLIKFPSATLELIDALANALAAAPRAARGQGGANEELSFQEGRLFGLTEGMRIHTAVFDTAVAWRKEDRPMTRFALRKAVDAALAAAEPQVEEGGKT